MRVEPHHIGSIVHVIKRGARGMEIVRDEHDRKRFLYSLYFLNEEYKSDYWLRETVNLPPFARPAHWPERKPLTNILAWTLLPNHLHLLLQVREDRERGITEFTQKLFRSMTGYFNEKYDERGSIFQGPYKSRTVQGDEYLRYVIPYIMVKNTLELYPGGLKKAVKNFEQSWDWAKKYQYTSLGSYTGETVSPIVGRPSVVDELFPTVRDLKSASHDMLSAYYERKQTDLQALQLED